MVSKAAKKTIDIVRIFASSDDGQRKAMHDIVVVTGWVGDQLRRLRAADHAAGTRHHGLPAFFCKRQAPGAEGIAAEIGSEGGGNPGLAAVARDFDGANAIAAVPSDTAERASGFELRALVVAGDQRVDHHLRYRRVGRRVLRGETGNERKFPKRNAIGSAHPETCLDRKSTRLNSVT